MQYLPSCMPWVSNGHVHSKVGIRMKSRSIRAAFCGSLFLCAAPAAHATLFTATGTYDEQAFQANKVDANFDGNPVTSTAPQFTVGNMTNAVASKFLVGQAGVINFDLPNGSSSPLSNQNGVIDVAFGVGKSLQITSTANVDY